MKKTVQIFTLAALMLVFVRLEGTASGSVVVDRVVAIVNGEIITMSDLQREESLKKTEGKLDEHLLLEDMIDRKLQMAAAKRAGMDVSDKELNDAMAEIMKRNSMDTKQLESALVKEGISLEQYRIELREQMMLSRTFNKFVRSGVAIDEKDVRSYYDRNLQDYSQPEEIRVRQIFFRIPDKAGPAAIAAVREKADAARARANKGEDFTALVKELSEGENAPTGGDLGFLQRDQAVLEIQEAMRNLKAGEIAGPVQFAGGFHVLKLEETRKPVKPFEKVKEEITRMLYEQKVENTYRTWLQSLRSDSNIENKL